MKNIYRQIYFYDAKLEKYDKGINGFTKVENYKEEMIKMFTSLEQLEFDKVNLQQSRYLLKANNTYDFIKIDQINENCIKGKLINSDDSGLQYYEKNGNLKFLKDIITEKR